MHESGNRTDISVNFFSPLVRRSDCRLWRCDIYRRGDLEVIHWDNFYSGIRVRGLQRLSHCREQRHKIVRTEFQKISRNASSVYGPWRFSVRTVAPTDSHPMHLPYSGIDHYVHILRLDWCFRDTNLSILF